MINETYLEEATEEDNKAKALADYLGISVEAVDNEDDNIYETPEGDYIVVNDYEADELAKNNIINSLEENGLNAFDGEFAEFLVDECIDMNAVDDYIQKEVEYYSDEGDDIERANELLDMSDEEKVDHIFMIMGSKSFGPWLRDNHINLLNFDAIRENRGYFNSIVDGEEINLGNNFYAYRY